MRLADRYDVVLLDLDGVLFRGNETVPGGPKTLATLRADGHRIAFVTNNSARTPDQVAHKLVGHGYAARADEVVTSALATADLLAAAGVREAFVVGEDGIRSALAEAGIQILDGEPQTAECVVIGWDREVTYDKLKEASLLVQRGARLVATNADRSYPAPDGLWPGAGAILAVVTTTTGVAPEVVGKPHPPLYLAAVRRVGGERPLVVGDRLETDIAGARALGWDSLLVLSGATTNEEAEAADLRPTYVGRDVSALLLDLHGSPVVGPGRQGRPPEAPTPQEQPRGPRAERKAADVCPVRDPSGQLGAELSHPAEDLEHEPPDQDDRGGKLDPGDEEEDHERGDACPWEEDEVRAEHRGDGPRSADGRERRPRVEGQVEQHRRKAPDAGRSR